MKVTKLALGAFASMTFAQVVPPQCGVSTIVYIIASSGCSITDAECVCKNKKAVDKMTKEIPKVCKATADQEQYSTFLNTQCVGKPGFPIKLATKNAAEQSRGKVAAVVVGAAALGVAAVL